MNIDYGTIIFCVILGVLGLVALWFFIFKVKHLKTPDVYCIDGGVKTGKSLVTVMLAIKQYKKNLFKYYIRNFLRKKGNQIRKLFKRPLKKEIEKPMLYSNMPLNRVKYNEFTKDILLWKVRIPHKSVVLIDEASLLADSMTGALTTKDKYEQFNETNEKLTLFLKLFGHATKGGSCFYNSQQIVDLHFAFKRCTSTYLFIAKNRKYPFFCLLDVREMVHTEDNDTVNVTTKDIDCDDKPLFVRKKYYKYYDCYYLYSLVAKLPLSVDYDVQKYIKHKDMCARKVVTLGNFKYVSEFNKNSEVIVNEKA